MRRQRQELCFWMCIAISLFASFGLAWSVMAGYSVGLGVLAGGSENDLGDAPDSTNGAGGLPLQAYPDGTVALYPSVHGAGSPPHGPIHREPKTVAYLGRSVTLEAEADDGADEDGFNNLQPLEEASNRDGGDDGVRLPLALPNYERTTLEYTVTVVRPQGAMYVNVWFDWNRDGDWDDTSDCPNGTQAPEWAVRNQAVALTTPGRLGLVTPPFVCWHPAGSGPAAIWLRITLSETPCSAAGGAASADGYLYGETEDYYLNPERPAGATSFNWLDKSTPWAQTVEDPVWKWSQWPDTTPNGVVMRADNSDGQKRALADDFECRAINCIAGVRFWGAWKNDVKGRLTKIRLRIYDNDPEGIQGPDAANVFPKPYPDILWQKEFGPGQFREDLYHAHPAGPWWSDPAMGQMAKPGSTELYQITVDIDPDDFFRQEGWAEAPRIYWLVVDVQIQGGQFGLQIRRPPEHSLGTALWSVEPPLTRPWQLLRHPLGHPSALSPQAAIDLAFCLRYTDCEAAPTIQPGGATRCPVVSTKCPTVATKCPAAATKCPTDYTKCPATNTRCPENYTTCPELWTNCPAESTQCPEASTRCPVRQTTCPSCTTPTVYPIATTTCPAVATRCPQEYTQCPELYTNCPAESTRCPEIYTACPSKDTTCPSCTTPTVYPIATTACPAVATRCPQEYTQCPELYTNCPAESTRCPEKDTYCPVQETRCPSKISLCPAEVTYCGYVHTKCPPVNTECPEVNTQCPAPSTTCTPASTQCPAVSTQCPPVLTKCPAPTTTCTPVVTQCPAVSTECPVVNTKCPATVSTCRTIFTQCPASNTSCPTLGTKCPESLTRCPPTGSICLTMNTVCPEQTTRCPTVLTVCPVEHTKCPEILSTCVTVVSYCPTVSTQCPEVNTQCPVRNTYCPTRNTGCPVRMTYCPVCE